MGATRGRARRRRSAWWSWLWLAPAVAGAAVDVPPATPAPAAATAGLEALDQRLGTLLDAHGVRGAAYAVWLADGRVHSRGFGYIDAERRRAVDGATPFPVGSITQSFVALALLRLAEEGRIALDARVHELAPEVPLTNPWQASDPITVAMLLEHTAGFDGTHFANRRNIADPPELPMHDVMQRLAPELRVRWRPGSRHAASDPGYAVAGFLIEKALRVPFEDTLAERVFRPLGLNATSAHLAPGLTPIYLRPAASAVSSADDLLRLARWLALRGADPPWLGAASILRMETSLTGLGPAAGFEHGLGLGNQPSEHRGVLFHGHEGGIDGYRARYAYAPQQRVAYVWLQAGGGAALATAAHRLLADAVVQGAAAPAPPAPGVPGLAAEAAGYWQPVNPPRALLAIVDATLGGARVRGDAERLTLAPLVAGTTQAFVHVGYGRLRRANEHHVSAVLTLDDDGTPLLWTRERVYRRGDAVSAWLPPLATAAALLVLLSALPTALVAALRARRGRRAPPRPATLRLLPPATTLALLVALAAIPGLRPDALAGPSVAARVIQFATCAFAALAALTLGAALWPRRVPARGLRWYAAAVGLAGLGLAAWMAAFGLIGTRLWLR
jgi:CubicO group peptidase (beta-lactamase class C family)